MSNPWEKREKELWFILVIAVIIVAAFVLWMMGVFTT
jgi:cell division protein FtsL